MGKPSVNLASASDLKLINELIPRLEESMNDDSLIKGWEAEKRIYNGSERGPLRAAAREIRTKSVKAVVSITNASESLGRFNGGASALSLSNDERAYLWGIQKLFLELQKAKEQDFDGCIRDGLEWCQNIQKRIIIRSGSVVRDSAGFTPTSPLTGTPDSAATKSTASSLNFQPATSVLPKIVSDPGENCEALLKELHRQRGSGHRGTAINRNLTKATKLAAETSEGEREVEVLQRRYLEGVRGLIRELRKEGEPDFDGQLRNAINFLENKGRKVCY